MKKYLLGAIALLCVAPAAHADYRKDLLATIAAFVAINPEKFNNAQLQELTKKHADGREVRKLFLQLLENKKNSAINATMIADENYQKAETLLFDALRLKKDKIKGFENTLNMFEGDEPVIWFINGRLEKTELKPEFFTELLETTQNLEKAVQAAA